MCQGRSALATNPASEASPPLTRGAGAPETSHGFCVLVERGPPRWCAALLWRSALAGLAVLIAWEGLPAPGQDEPDTEYPLRQGHVIAATAVGQARRPHIITD